MGEWRGAQAKGCRSRYEQQSERHIVEATVRGGGPAREIGAKFSAARATVTFALTRGARSRTDRGHESSLYVAGRVARGLWSVVVVAGAGGFERGRERERDAKPERERPAFFVERAEPGEWGRE